MNQGTRLGGGACDVVGSCKGLGGGERRRQCLHVGGRQEPRNQGTTFAGEARRMGVAVAEGMQPCSHDHALMTVNAFVSEDARNQGTKEPDSREGVGHAESDHVELTGWMQLVPVGVPPSIPP